jgi:hypothetical protein
LSGAEGKAGEGTFTSEIDSLEKSFAKLSTLCEETFAGPFEIDSLEKSFAKLSTLCEETFAGPFEIDSLEKSFAKLSTLCEETFAGPFEIDSLEKSFAKLSTSFAGTFNLSKDFEIWVITVSERVSLCFIPIIINFSGSPFPKIVNRLPNSFATMPPSFDNVGADLRRRSPTVVK